MSSVSNLQSIARYAASAPAQTSVGTMAGEVLALNLGRRGLIIQNTGTTIIYLVLGSSTPTTSVYHIALKACSITDDGNGGIYNDDAWVGAVQAIGSDSGGTIVITEVS